MWTKLTQIIKKCKIDINYDDIFLGIIMLGLLLLFTFFEPYKGTIRYATLQIGEVKYYLAYAGSTDDPYFDLQAMPVIAPNSGIIMSMWRGKTAPIETESLNFSITVFALSKCFEVLEVIHLNPGDEATPSGFGRYLVQTPLQRDLKTGDILTCFSPDSTASFPIYPLCEGQVAQ